MTRFIRVAPIIAGLALVAACGKSEVDPQLAADLEAAAAEGNLELAPSGAGTNVVSGIEQVQRAQPRPTAPQPKAPVTTPSSTVTSTQAPASSEPAATRPSTRPAVQPPPPGGYKTVDEVIRKAPFPIKP